jgi:HEAT repeats
VELIEQLKNTPRWQERRELISQSNDAAVLLAWLPSEKEGWVRAALATRLGVLGGPAAHKALETLAQDDSGLVRVAAIQALDAIQNLEARFQIREAYEREDDPLVRRAAVESRVPVGDAAALGKLEATLAYETDPNARALAIYQAMLDAGSAVLPRLRQLWRSETTPRVRVEVAEILLRLGDSDDRECLAEALAVEPTPQVRRVLIEHLKRAGEVSGREAFLAWFPHETEPALQLSLMSALRRWPDRDCFRALVLTQHPGSLPVHFQHRREAWESILAQLPSPVLGSWLLEEPEVHVRLVLVQALRKRSDPPLELFLALLRRERDPVIAKELIEALVAWESLDHRTLFSVLFEEHRAYESAHASPSVVEEHAIYELQVSDLLWDALQRLQPRTS